MPDLGDPVPDEATLVNVERHSGEAVVVLRGEVDLNNVGRLDEALAPLLADDDRPCLVFDMTALEFMDSSALGCLLRVAGSGKSVRLRHPSAIIAEVITTATGLGAALEIEP